MDRSGKMHSSQILIKLVTVRCGYMRAKNEEWVAPKITLFSFKLCTLQVIACTLESPCSEAHRHFHWKCEVIIVFSRKQTQSYYKSDQRRRLISEKYLRGKGSSHLGGSTRENISVCELGAFLGTGQDRRATSAWTGTSQAWVPRLQPSRSGPTAGLYSCCPNGSSAGRVK